MAEYSKLALLSGGIVTNILLTSNTLSIGTVKTDSIIEATSANGVSIDGLSIKDGKLNTADSVVETNITNLAVTDAKLAGSISDGKLAEDYLKTNEIDNSTLEFSTTAHIKALGITDSHISTTAGITLSKLAALTADRALLSNGTGVIAVSSVTNTELGYLSGVTGAIQTQIGGKLSLSGGTMTGAITLAADPTAALHAATKQYVDQLAITGGVVKEALLTNSQLSNTQGILAAEVAYIVTNPTADDTFIIKNDSATETFTFKASESVAFDVEIGLTETATMTNLVNAINADSSYYSAIFTADGLDAIYSNGVIVIYEKTAASGTSTSRIYGTIAGGQDDLKVVEYNGAVQYSTAKSAIDLPSTDPAAGRFGLRRQLSEVINGEIHLCLASDELYEYNDDSDAWFLLSGSGSVPDATSAAGGGVKGKVTFDSNKGLSVSSGIAEVKIDNSSIGFTTGSLYVKASGITNDMLAGSIADSKLSQITTANKVAGSAVQLNATGALEDSTGLKVKVDGTTIQINGSNQLSLVSATASKVYVTLTNNTGSQIDAGTVVALSQTTAGEVIVADASAIATCEGVIGVASANIANAASGLIQVSGEVTVLNGGTSFDLGKRVYVSTTAGQGTKTAPSATNEVIYLLGIASDTAKVVLQPNLVGIEA